MPTSFPGSKQIIPRAAPIDETDWNTFADTAEAMQDSLLSMVGTPGAGAITWINVKTDHGATGNGTSDDWAALQAAHDAATNGLGVYYPPGTYDISKSLVVGLNKAATSASQSHQDDPVVLFSPGAQITPHSSFSTGVASPDNKPLLFVLASDARILYPRVSGTGAKGSGVGIQIGGGRNWRGADTVTTTLTAAVTTTTATTITVASAAAFPDVEGFFVSIDGERMFVRGGAGTTTWTVTRGEDGGDVAETHLNGATVTLLGFQTVYRSAVYQPVVTNCASGLEFGIKENSSSSTGDCNVFGGFITNSKRGIHSRGFVNRVWGTTVTTCDVNLDVSDVRTSSKVEAHGLTLNNATNAAIWVRGGEGSYINGFWAEDSGGSSTGAVVRLGQTSGSDGATASSTAYNTKIAGDCKIHPDTVATQDDLIHLVRCVGLDIDTLTLSTNSTLPPACFVRVAGTVQANASNRIKKITAWPGSGGKNRMTNGVALPTPVIFSSPSIENQLVIESHYETHLDSNIGTTIGDFNIVIAPASYTVYRSAVNGVTTYYAKNRFGHIRAFFSDTATVSGLTSLMDSLKGAGVSFHFTDGTFSFLDDVAGQFNASFSGYAGMSFKGEGPQATIIRSLSNATTGADSEPLSFVRCNNLYVADMTLRSEGTARQTSDGLDFDGCSDTVVERVWVTAARGNGFHTDGKDDAAWPARRVVFNNCLATGCGSDGFELLASEDCELVACVAYGNTVHGVQLAKASATAGIPNKKTVGCRVSGTFYENGQDGVNINSCDNNRVTGLVKNNSNVTANRDGVRISTSDTIAANRNVISVTASDDQTTPTQRYGVNVGPTSAGEANDNEVSNVAGSGNGAALFADTGTRTVRNGTVLMTATAYAALTPKNDLVTYVISG